MTRSERVWIGEGTRTSEDTIQVLKSSLRCDHFLSKVGVGSRRIIAISFSLLHFIRISLWFIYSARMPLKTRAHGSCMLALILSLVYQAVVRISLRIAKTLYSGKLYKIYSTSTSTPIYQRPPSSTLTIRLVPTECSECVPMSARFGSFLLFPLLIPAMCRLVRSLHNLELRSCCGKE